MANGNLRQGWMGHQNRLKLWGGHPSLVVVLGRGDVQASTALSDGTKSVGNSVCKHGPSSTVLEEISKVGNGRLRGMAGRLNVTSLVGSQSVKPGKSEWLSSVVHAKRRLEIIDAICFERVHGSGGSVRKMRLRKRVEHRNAKIVIRET